MEISCVYIPEINEQEEDILLAFRDIAKIEHIEFFVHTRYARVMNNRSSSRDFDSENISENNKKKTKSKAVFGLNLSFKRKPKRVAYVYIQKWYNFDFCLKVLKRDAYLGKWQILPNENTYQIELYKLQKRVASLENVLAQQTMSNEKFNNDNNMVDSLISILLNNNLETEQTLDDGWLQYKECNCDGTFTMNQNYLAYLKQRLQNVL
jgi:hypothetical protein